MKPLFIIPERIPEGEYRGKFLEQVAFQHYDAFCASLPYTLKVKYGFPDFNRSRDSDLEGWLLNSKWSALNAEVDFKLLNEFVPAVSCNCGENASRVCIRDRDSRLNTPEGYFCREHVPLGAYNFPLKWDALRKVSGKINRSTLKNMLVEATGYSNPKKRFSEKQFRDFFFNTLASNHQLAKKFRAMELSAEEGILADDPAQAKHEFETFYNGLSGADKVIASLLSGVYEQVGEVDY